MLTLVVLVSSPFLRLLRFRTDDRVFFLLTFRS